MWTPRVRALYKRGKDDKDFLSAIKSAGDDAPPSVLSDKIDKVLFATVYYGWLVAKYGDKWNQ